MSELPENPLVPQADQPTDISAFGTALQALPASNRLDDKARRDLDLAEGMHPAAEARSNSQTGKTTYEIARIIFLLLVLILSLYWFFPKNRFFAAKLQNAKSGLEVETLSDAKVRKLGGREKLAPEQKALYEVSGMREQGEMYEAKKRCEQDLQKLQRTAAEYKKWLPLWKVYLSLLEQLQEFEELKKVCHGLQETLPDFVESKYYLCKLQLKEIAVTVKVNKKQRAALLSELDTWQRNCEIAKTTLSQVNKDKACNDLFEQFTLQLAEIFRQKWRLHNYSWSNSNRELAFAMLQEMPQDSREACELRLQLLYDCKNAWRWRWWLWGAENRLVDKQTINLETLQKWIKQEEERLASKA